MSTILSPRKRVGLTQFRSVLLASAAAAALCLSPARPAQADCSFLRASQEIICTGDVSDGANFWQLPGGVKIATDYTKLTVHDVTGDITPAPGRRGVALDQASFLSIEVDSNVTPYRFVTTGDGAPGVYGFSLFDVTVRNTGDVVTSGQHSDAVVSNTFWGVAKVVNTGNLSTAGDDSNGIYAASGYGTVVSVVSQGDITTMGARSSAIRAVLPTNQVTYPYNVVVATQGRLATGGDDAHGIYARSTGSADISSKGAITTTGARSYGMRVFADSGTSVLHNEGDITTSGDGAIAIGTRAPGSAAIYNIGNIVTSGPVCRWAGGDQRQWAGADRRHRRHHDIRSERRRDLRTRPHRSRGPQQRQFVDGG